MTPEEREVWITLLLAGCVGSSADGEAAQFLLLRMAQEASPDRVVEGAVKEFGNGTDQHAEAIKEILSALARGAERDWSREAADSQIAEEVYSMWRDLLEREGAKTADDLTEGRRRTLLKEVASRHDCSVEYVEELLARGPSLPGPAILSFDELVLDDLPAFLELPDGSFENVDDATPKQCEDGAGKRESEARAMIQDGVRLRVLASFKRTESP